MHLSVLVQLFIHLVSMSKYDLTIVFSNPLPNWFHFLLFWI